MVTPIAHDTGRELLRIDLGKLTSKFIGETEKNLNRLFETTDPSRTILLRRSRRLLQRLEPFRGIVLFSASSDIDPLPQQFPCHILRLPAK